jgi:hypothetical protein
MSRVMMMPTRIRRLAMRILRTMRMVVQQDDSLLVDERLYVCTSREILWRSPQRMIVMEMLKQCCLPLVYRCCLARSDVGISQTSNCASIQIAFSVELCRRLSRVLRERKFYNYIVSSTNPARVPRNTGRTDQRAVTFRKQRQLQFAP